MMRIKKYYSFINEISGTELVGPVGPGYGETRLQNKTVDSSDTNVIYSELDGRIYTEDEYIDIYNNYLKSGGKPLDGFNIDNINTILSYIQDDSFNI